MAYPFRKVFLFCQSFHPHLMTFLQRWRYCNNSEQIPSAEWKNKPNCQTAISKVTNVFKVEHYKISHFEAASYIFKKWGWLVHLCNVNDVRKWKERLWNVSGNSFFRKSKSTCWEGICQQIFLLFLFPVHNVVSKEGTIKNLSIYQDINKTVPESSLVCCHGYLYLSQRGCWWVAGSPSS